MYACVDLCANNVGGRRKSLFLGVRDHMSVCQYVCLLYVYLPANVPHSV